MGIHENYSNHSSDVQSCSSINTAQIFLQSCSSINIARIFLLTIFSQSRSSINIAHISPKSCSSINTAPISVDASFKNASFSRSNNSSAKKHVKTAHSHTIAVRLWQSIKNPRIGVRMRGVIWCNCFRINDRVKNNVSLYRAFYSRIRRTVPRTSPTHPHHAVRSFRRGVRFIGHNATSELDDSVHAYYFSAHTVTTYSLFHTGRAYTAQHNSRQS